MLESDIDTVLGEDIKFRGKLQFRESLQINGKFQGKIDTEGHLVIGPTAQVIADVEAATVTIQGDLQGNIVARQKIDLMNKARLAGDIRTPDLEIQSGSRFSGNCIMD
jgi:cytoskeletal protein CcmA (bactofilin family)